MAGAAVNEVFPSSLRKAARKNRNGTRDAAAIWIAFNHGLSVSELLKVRARPTLTTSTSSRRQIRPSYWMARPAISSQIIEKNYGAMRVGMRTFLSAWRLVYSATALCRDNRNFAPRART
jgi:hypothetical protein